MKDSKKKINSKGNKSLKNKASKLLEFNHIKRFWIVISITLAITLILTLSGFWIDQHFNTKPLFLIIALISSFPIAQIVVYKKMKNYTQNEFKRLNIKTRSKK